MKAKIVKGTGSKSKQFRFILYGSNGRVIATGEQSPEDSFNCEPVFKMTTLNIIQYNDKTTSCLVVGEVLKDFAKYTTTKEKYPVAVFRFKIEKSSAVTEDSDKSVINS